MLELLYTWLKTPKLNTAETIIDERELLLSPDDYALLLAEESA